MLTISHEVLDAFLKLHIQSLSIKVYKQNESNKLCLKVSSHPEMWIRNSLQSVTQASISVHMEKLRKPQMGVQTLLQV